MVGVVLNQKEMKSLCRGSDARPSKHTHYNCGLPLCGTDAVSGWLGLVGFWFLVAVVGWAVEGTGKTPAPGSWVARAARAFGSISKKNLI
jgi:hypothetical protein